MKKLLTICLALLMTALRSFAQPDIVEGEYFWDIDPGVGNATAFSTGAPGTDLDISFTPSTSGLSNGNHILGFRTKDANGVWGETFTKPMHVHYFTELEYFFDTDPGVGNAESVVFNSNLSTFSGDVNLNSSITDPGPHLLGVRTKGIGEKWGNTSYTNVWVADYSNQGEYFWDTDPGVGNGNAFTFDNTASTFTGDVQFSSVGLTSGYHNLYIRMRAASGTWGQPKRKTIWVADNIAGGEYFWDTDPGVGNGFPIPVYIASDESSVCGQFTTDGLTEGTHYLYVRTYSEKGSWSHPSRVEMLINASEIVVGCPGDFDRNGSINTSDLLLFLGNFSTTGDCSFDLTGDFTVNTSDLLLFLAAYGTICD